MQKSRPVLIESSVFPECGTVRSIEDGKSKMYRRIQDVVS